MEEHNNSFPQTEVDFDKDAYLAILEMNWYMKHHPEQLSHLFFDDEEHHLFCENNRTKPDLLCPLDVVWKKEGF